MKKHYEPAEITIKVIDAQDAIATSGGKSDVTKDDLGWED